MDKELFEQVVESFIEKYHLTKENPYRDSYFILRDEQGNKVAELNPEGYNLLYNLYVLTEDLEMAGFMR